jgi:hypothetical protein
VTNSIEILYHFSCKECKGWWSIAVENFMGAKSREWYCPWCGVKELHNERSIPVGGEVSSENDK